MTTVGGILVAVGIAGMIIVGSDMANVAQHRGFPDLEVGHSFGVAE
jgi:hypothetical protein